MGEKKYLVADVTEKLNIPLYMLKYYEDALSISIPRNERGMRYYRRQEIELFRSVINLQKKGFELGAIKLVLDDIHRIEKLPPEKLIELRDRLDVVMDKRSFSEEETKEKARGKVTVFERKPEETTVAVRKNRNYKSEVKPVGEADERMLQFKSIMTDIVLEALKINNEDLGRRINYTVTDSVVREVGYLMTRQDEEAERRFKKLDESLREVCATHEKKGC